MNNEEKILNKKDIKKAALRWMPMAVNTFNFESQQAASIVYSLSPALRKIYKNDEDYKESLNNHFTYFNCMPWLANIILGVTLALEEKGKLASKEAVTNFKTSMMGPLSGIGDTIFWVLVPTIIGSIAGYMAQEGNGIGVIIWIMLNIAFMFMRVRLFELGYKEGVKLITIFSDKLSSFTESASILGLVVVGSLIPTVIKVNVPFIFKFGEVNMEVQPLLDKILPALIPVLLTLGIYKLVKSNKFKITTVIFLVIGFCILGAGLGILG